MKLTKRNAKLVKDVILDFEKKNMLSSEKATELLQDIDVIGFDYKKLSKWSFVFSASCFVVSLTGLPFIFQYKVFRILISILLSGVFYYLGFRNKNDKKLLHEFFIFIGALSTTWFIGEIEIYNIFFKDLYNLTLFIAIMYGIISYYGQSNLVLISSLLKFGVWFGATIGYIGYGSYVLGISKPSSFLIFGLLLILISYVINITKYDKIKFSFKTFLSMGLLSCFLSLWILSIFGNGVYNNIEATKLSLIFWSLLFGISSLLSLYFGLKYDNYMLKGYGITFFLINLYTKYCEYFWNNSNKFIFFLILTLSFYFIGKKSEEVYLVLEKKVKKINN